MIAMLSVEEGRREVSFLLLEINCELGGVGEASESVKSVPARRYPFAVVR